MKTTTYRIGYADECDRCGSNRSGRGVGEYRIHENGSETLINCSDCRKFVSCTCGERYHVTDAERECNPHRINDVADGCKKCIPDRHRRELRKAASRCRLRLAQHIARVRNGGDTAREIHRDVAVRYLQRFDGQTFAVQTSVDTAEIYLENAKGSVIGKVLYTDKYPKPPDCDFSTMPF